MIQPEMLASAAEPTQVQRRTAAVSTPLSLASRSDCEQAFQTRPIAECFMTARTIAIAAIDVAMAATDTRPIWTGKGPS